MAIRTNHGLSRFSGISGLIQTVERRAVAAGTAGYKQYLEIKGKVSRQEFMDEIADHEWLTVHWYKNLTHKGRFYVFRITDSRTARKAA